MTKALIFFFAVVVLVGVMAYSNAPERITHNDAIYKAVVR